MSLGAFVEGAFNGWNFVDDVRYRKQAAERQKRLDALQEEQWDKTFGLQSRAADRADQLAARQQQEYDYLVKQRDDMRAAAEAGVSAADEAMQTPGASVYTYDAEQTPAMPGDPPTMGALSGGAETPVSAAAKAGIPFSMTANFWRAHCRPRLAARDTMGCWPPGPSLATAWPRANMATAFVA